MRPILKIISLLSALVLLLSVTACSNTDDAYIYFQLNEIPRTVDPQTAKTSTELLIAQNIYEGLMRFDRNGKLQCAVAESFEKQGLTYIFNIRKNAKWKNGDKITANDFVFAFKRALSSDTEAPFASLLFSIKNAKEFLSGKSDELGVTALNDNTLKIELAYDDADFLEVLSYPISMPCNEEFFVASKGKYGLDTDYILSNGSYRLTKWGKEIFGIRLYRHDDYNGDFKAENAAIFLSYNDKLSATEVLMNKDADIAFISSNDIEKLNQQGFKTDTVQNTVWFLTLSNDLPAPIRKAFSILASGEVFANNLSFGTSVATSLFPPVFNADVGASGILPYNLETAKKLYSDEIGKMDGKKLPSDIKLYYYDSGFSKNMVTSIVGHWQNHLGAYINIETVSSAELLSSQLKNQTYYMSIFPITAQNPSLTEYLSNFGIDYKNGELNRTQLELLSKNNIVPLAFESYGIGYGGTLENVNFKSGGGALDISFIVKNEE